MWELDYKESWAPKNWTFWTMVLEKTLESPLDCKEIQPVYPKGDQSWVFIGRTDVETETPIFWPLMWRADSFEKTLMLGKIEGKKRRGRQDNMVGWHHRLILCRSLLLPPSLFPSFRVFTDVSALHIGGQSIGVSALASFLPKNTQDWFPCRSEERRVGKECYV